MPGAARLTLFCFAVLSPVVAQDSGKLLEARMHARLAPMFDQRRQAVAAVRTAEQMRAHQASLRTKFRRVLGEFPDKTPLKPRVLGRIDRPGYTIDKVIFESRPAHHVTANLYTPKGVSGRLPGVLVPCGHSRNGKASELYQSVCVELAQNGMVALCYDPIGQGERLQLLGKDGKSRVWGTSEHTLVGIGALLVGRHLAHYRIWDGIRAIDYLCSLAAVDPARIGCTGNSGGGTMTSYLMAMDPRIVAAAPSCFLTSLERVFATIGPQDAEQNFPSQVKLGIEHADFLTMRAPKPTLMLVATQDFFDIEGSWTCYREAKRLYGLLGRGEQVDLFEFDDKHGFSTPRRHAAVRFLSRWLEAGATEPVFSKVVLCKDAELQCTKSGQVLRDIVGSRSVVELNTDRSVLLSKRRGVCKVDDVRRVIACPAKHDGFPVDVSEGSEASIRIRTGNRLYAVSVRGRGATTARGRRTYGGWFGPDFHPAFLAMHAGDSLLGLRVSDVRRALDTLEDAAGAVTIEADADGQAVALHAALLDARIGRVTLTSPLRSWTDLVSSPLQTRRIGDVVPGALELYDLPELVRALEERGCKVERPEVR
jgi:dienelactone hydrolase